MSMMQDKSVSRKTPGPRHSPLGYALLFAPYLVAFLLQDWALGSYSIAWLGSWAILYLTLTGRVRRLPQNLAWHHQLLRPFALTQLVFAGFACLTSVFYVLDLHGYYYLSTNMIPFDEWIEMDRVAAAQRYYVLGHAAVATGMLVFADYSTSGRWRLRLTLPLPVFLLGLTALMTAIVPLLPSIGLSQVAVRLQQMALVASVLALSEALPRKHLGATLLGIGLFAYNVVLALLSGWKEDVIVVFILLCVFLYPRYRRTVTLLAPIGIALVLLALPTYNQRFREASWFGRQSDADAAVLAAADVRSGADQLLPTTWEFLSTRATEIGMFTGYLKRTPEYLPFQGTALVEQAIEMLVPRALWPTKPNVEMLVMQRVYDNQVIDPQSSVSAKPHFLVDGYLSGGALGVLLAGLAYGLVATLASRLAERWFDGYLIGSGLLYTSLFKELWRGNCFEFLLNTVLWSFVIMAALFGAARASGLLTRARA